MTLSAKQIETLGIFILDEDRSVPPYYAGRSEILADIEARVNLKWKRQEVNEPQASGMTRILYGAPGAGKSSTLMHLKRKWNAAGSRDFAPCMLYLSTPGEFEDGELLTELVAEALRSGLGERVRRHTAIEDSVKLGVGSTGIGRVTKSGSRPPADPIDAALQHLPASEWKRPLVVAIDEFQNMSGDRNDAHAKMLQGLHGQR